MFFFRICKVRARALLELRRREWVVRPGGSIQRYAGSKGPAVVLYSISRKKKGVSFFLPFVRSTKISPLASRFVRLVAMIIFPKLNKDMLSSMTSADS